MIDFSENLERYMISQPEIAAEGVGLVLVAGFTGLITLGAILTKIENYKKHKRPSEYHNITKKMVASAVEIQTTISGQKILNTINTKLPPIISEYNSTMNNYVHQLRSATDKNVKADISASYRKVFMGIQGRAKALLKTIEDMSGKDTEKVDITNDRRILETYVDLSDNMKYPLDGDSFEEVFDGIEIDSTVVEAAINTAGYANRDIYRVYDKGASNILIRFK